MEEKTFKFIGFQVEELQNSIVLDHSNYIVNLKNVTLDPGRASQKNELLNEKEQKLFRQLIGQLN